MTVSDGHDHEETTTRPREHGECAAAIHGSTLMTFPPLTSKDRRNGEWTDLGRVVLHPFITHNYVTMVGRLLFPPQANAAIYDRLF